jgi:hypothetical protein
MLANVWSSLATSDIKMKASLHIFILVSKTKTFYIKENSTRYSKIDAELYIKKSVAFVALRAPVFLGPKNGAMRAPRPLLLNWSFVFKNQQKILVWDIKKNP